MIDTVYGIESAIERLRANEMLRFERRVQAMRTMWNRPEMWPMPKPLGLTYGEWEEQYLSCQEDEQ